MEIKLKTTRSDDEGWTIVDEYGALWNLEGPKPAHGIFVASTKGQSGEPISGFYLNGTLFIVNFHEARKYFGSMKLEHRRDVHHL